MFLLDLVWLCGLDEGDMPGKVGVSMPALLKTCSPHAYRNVGVTVWLLYDLIYCSECWCLVV